MWGHIGYGKYCWLARPVGFLKEKKLRSVEGSRSSVESPGKKGTEVLWVFTFVQIAPGKVDLGNWRGQNQESKMDSLTNGTKY